MFCALILIVFWWMRLHNLLVLPLFMDEATHLTRAQAVWQGKPFDLLLTGKALGPYLAALFDPFNAAPWIGRYVVVLVSSIGVASVIALGRALHSRQAGLFAGVLWLFSPYLFFFERMALVDTTVASFTALSAFLAVRMIRTGKIRDALLCGVALALCVFAKTTGIIFLVIPVGVAVLLPYKMISIPSRARQAILATLVALLILIGPAFYIRSQGANVFGIGTLASGETNTLSERLSANIQTAWDAYRDYFQPIFWMILLLGAVAAIGLYPRRALLLAMLSVVPFATLIITATQLYLRYLVIVLPGLLILAAVGFVGVTRFVRWLRPLPWAVIGIWAILFALPFITTAYGDPGALPLPSHDRNEYLDGWTAGFALRDAAAGLVAIAQKDSKSLSVVGLVSSCNTIRVYVPPNSNVTVQCPDVWDGTGQGISTGQQLIRDAAQRSGYAFALGEIGGAVYSSAVPDPREQAAIYGRPDGRYSVVLYRVSP